MTARVELPVDELRATLEKLPRANVELRAVLAHTCARWYLIRDEAAKAGEMLTLALRDLPEFRPALRLWQTLHVRQSDVQAALECLDREIRATRHPREAGALYRGRGRLVELEFGDYDATEQCHSAARKVVENDLCVLRALERVRMMRGDLAGVEETLVEQMRLLERGNDQAVLAHQRALSRLAQGDDIGAISSLRDVLDDSAGSICAAHDLELLAANVGDDSAGLLALERLIAKLPREQSAIVAVRIASLLLRREDPDGALSVLRAQAEGSTASASLWRAIERIAAIARKPVQRVNAAAQRLRSMMDADPVVRAEWSYRLGRMALRYSATAAVGVAALERAHAWAPTHPWAWDELADWLAAEQRWGQLLENYETMVRQGRGPYGEGRNHACHASFCAGQLLEERLGELEAAERSYRRACALDENFRPARDRLERVLFQRGQTSALRRLYRDELGSDPSRDRRIFLLSLLAQFGQSDGGASRQVVEDLAALLKEVPEHLTALQQLARMLARRGRISDLLRLTRREIQITAGRHRRAKLRHRAAELSLELGDSIEASEHLSRAIAEVPGHPPTLRLLARVAERGDQADDRIAAMRSRLDACRDRRHAAYLRRDLARELLRRESGGGPKSELLALFAPDMSEGAVTAEPLILCEWGDDGRDQDAAIHRLELRAAGCVGRVVRGGLWLRAALAHAGRGRPERAFSALESALDVAPQLPATLDIVLVLAAVAGAERRFGEFVQRALSPKWGPAFAVSLCERLLDYDPELPDAWLPSIAHWAGHAGSRAGLQRNLAMLAMRRGHYDVARRAFGRCIEALANERSPAGENKDGPDKGKQLGYLGYLAGRCNAWLGDPDGAQREWVRALSFDPDQQLVRRALSRGCGYAERDMTTRQAALLDGLRASCASGIERATIDAELALLHLELGDTKASEAAARRGIEADAGHLPARLALALARARNPDRARAALEALEEVAKMASSAALKGYAWGELARVALTSGDLVAAVGGAAQAVLADPGHDAHFERLLRCHRDWLRDGGGTSAAENYDFRLRVQVIESRWALLKSEKVGATDPRWLLVAEYLSELAGSQPAAEVQQSYVVLIESARSNLPHEARIFACLARASARSGDWAAASEDAESALKAEADPQRQRSLRLLGARYAAQAKAWTRAFELLEPATGDIRGRAALLSTMRGFVSSMADLEERKHYATRLLRQSSPFERAELLAAIAVDEAELEPGAGLGDAENDELMRRCHGIDPRNDAALIGIAKWSEEPVNVPEQSVAISDNTRAEVTLAELRAELAELQNPGARFSELAGRISGTLERMGRSDLWAMARAIVDVSSGSTAVRDEEVQALGALPRPSGALTGADYGQLRGEVLSSLAVDALHTCVLLLPRIPGVSIPNIDELESLDDQRELAIVVERIAQMLGVETPRIFAHPGQASADLISATSLSGGDPVLLVGQRHCAHPRSAQSRESIGRAIFRAGLGGDAVFEELGNEGLASLYLGSCDAAQSQGDSEPGPSNDHSEFVHDPALRASVRDALRAVEWPPVLRTRMRRFTTEQGRPTLKPRLFTRLMEDLQHCEDRCAMLSAGDPRPVLRNLHRRAGLESRRGRALCTFVLSDAHEAVRARLGYGHSVVKGDDR